MKTANEQRKKKTNVETKCKSKNDGLHVGDAERTSIDIFRVLTIIAILPVIRSIQNASNEIDRYVREKKGR